MNVITTASLTVKYSYEIVYDDDTGMLKHAAVDGKPVATGSVTWNRLQGIINERRRAASDSGPTILHPDWDLEIHP